MKSSDFHESEWYEALFEEDCPQVLKLLKENPSLWKRGWESERVAKGSRTSPWKGRSALHVGARRGCAELVKQVLDLCMKEMKENEEKARAGRSLQAGEKKSPGGVLSQVEEESASLDPVRNAVALWKNQTAGRSLQAGEKKSPRGVISQVEEESASLDPVRNAVALWKNQIRCKSLQRAESKLRNLKVDSADRFLEDLILLRDGEYKLDAIAMAVVNGNIDVLSILLNASPDANLYTCKTIPQNDGLPFKNGDSLHAYERRKTKAWKREATTPKSRSATNHVQLEQLGIASSPEREQLSKVTAVIIDYFRSDRSDNPQFLLCRACLKRYDKHRDFNFLPINEYLFHFLFTDCFKEIPDEMADREGHIKYPLDQIEEVLLQILDGIWLKCETISLDFCKFLSELRDGQGRAPFHVAVDESTVPRFLIMMSNHKETHVPWAIKAVDGGGRTALHRAIILGKESSARYLLDPTQGYDFRDEILLDPTPSDETEDQILFDPTPDYEFGDEILNQIGKMCSCGAFQHPVVDALESRFNIVLDVDALSKRNGLEGSFQHTKVDSLPSKSNILRDMRGVLDRVLSKTTEFGDFKGISKLKDSAPSISARECHTYAPIHSAIIHKRKKVLPLLLERLADEAAAFSGRVHIRGPEQRQVELDYLELATFVGDLSVVTQLIDWSKRRQGAPSSYTRDTNHTLPAVHVAAASGKYELLQMLLEHGHYDPFIKDIEENTALHHATKGSSIPCEFHTHLLDYVNCQQILKSQQDREEELKIQSKRKCLETDAYLVERQGCINLLLQAGCDMFKSNKYHEAAHPGHETSNNAEYLTWWYEKQAKEFGTVQSTLSIAANAITVTAALVATASYVGPLQPPLGYNEDNNQLQVDIVWVRMFIVCDTMSFYLAIAAIIFSLIPSLPMPQQSMLRELNRTRKMVTLAVAILLPSLVFVLLAFGSSSIAVIRSKVGSWNSGGLTIGTAAIGGVICMEAILLFFIRLLGFVFPRNIYIKKLYYATFS